MLSENSYCRTMGAGGEIEGKIGFISPYWYQTSILHVTPGELLLNSDISTRNNLELEGVSV